MSFTRTKYDQCDYAADLQQQQGMFSYTMDTNKFYNCDQTRVDFGLLGGNNVSQSQDNLVDLESDLRNQTRLYSNCPTRKFRPNCDVTQCSNANGLPCGDKKCQAPMHHMKEGSLIDYRPRYNNSGYTLEGLGCPGNPTSFHTDPSQFTNRNDAFKYAQAPGSLPGHSQVRFMKEVAQ